MPADAPKAPPTQEIETDSGDELLPSQRAKLAGGILTRLLGTVCVCV